MRHECSLLHNLSHDEILSKVKNDSIEGVYSYDSCIVDKFEGMFPESLAAWNLYVMNFQVVCSSRWLMQHTKPDSKHVTLATQRRSHGSGFLRVGV